MSSSTTPCAVELKASVYGVSDAFTDTLMLQLPLAGTVKGLGATAPAGRPDTVTASPGTPVPHTVAGVEPPDQTSDDARTMCDAKTRLSGPQRAAAGRGEIAAAAAIAASKPRIILGNGADASRGDGTLAET